MLPDGKPFADSLAMLGVAPGCDFFVQDAGRWQWVREPWNPGVAVCIRLDEYQQVELATDGCVLSELSHWCLTPDGGSAAHKHLISLVMRS